jgi:hypothetical protein
MQTCSEGLQECLSSPCPASPHTCLAAQKSILLLKNKTDNSKDKLTWKWIKGAATLTSDFADPTTTANYALCIYAGTTDALVAQMSLPAGSKWSALGTKGFKYNDPTLSPDGAQKAILKSGAPGKSKALVKGKGTNLPDPLDGGPLPFPVTVQLFNYQTGLCLDSTFNMTNALKNTSTLFKAKTP